MTYPSDNTDLTKRGKHYTGSHMKDLDTEVWTLGSAFANKYPAKDICCTKYAGVYEVCSIKIE